MYGKHIEGTLRIDVPHRPNGRIAQVWRSVRVDGHADAVIAALSAATTARQGRGDAGREATSGRRRQGSAAEEQTAAKASAAKARPSKAKAPKRARRT